MAYCTAAAVPGSIVFLILLADQKRRKKSDGEAVIEAGRWPSVAQSQFGRVAVAKPDEARSFRKRSGRLPVAVVPHLQLPYRSMIRFLSFFFFPVDNHNDGWETMPYYVYGKRDERCDRLFRLSSGILAG